MSNIGGEKRQAPQFEEKEFPKKVGLFEAKVIAVNPTREEYADILGRQLTEESKATDYLGTSKDGNPRLRLDFWLEDVKTQDKFKLTFFVEDKQKENRDGTKKQYINDVGRCTWADSPNNLPSWFKERENRVAYVGEEDLYNFLRSWLNLIDFSKKSSKLQLEFNRLIKGNVKEIKEEINGEWAGNFVAMATINTQEKEDGIREYQTIYNKAFMPPYSIKAFRLVDYNRPETVRSLRQKQTKELKPHEKFVLNVMGEYGCKDYYTFKELTDYSASDNLVASDRVLAEDDSDF
ncbi:MAG: hypothetical protein EBR30_24245 [Cytophagia bacterium]|jgi:hypothetical protein|nr:hypothetical protein [Cytophagia bacterium]